MTPPKRERYEHTEQAIVVGRFRNFYPETAGLLFAVPNAKGTRSRAEMKRLKDEGVLAGVSDLILLAPRGKYHGAVIEMKRSKGGRLTPGQRAFLDRARAEGFHTIVGVGANDAWLQLEMYMELGPHHPPRRIDCLLIEDD